MNIFRKMHKMTKFEGTWMKKFRINYIFLPTSFGICRTVNLLENDEMFQKTVDETFLNRESIIVLNAAIEVKGNSEKNLRMRNKNLGIDGYAYDGLGFNSHWSDKTPYRIIFHPPYELPNENSNNFFVSKNDHVTFLITPQLKSIDDSLYGMTSKRCLSYEIL